MGAKKKALAAGAAAKSAKDNQYVRRLVEDEDLRDNLRQAYESAQDAYERMSRGKSAGKLLDDKKLQKDLRLAAESIRDASHSLREGPKKKGGFMRKVMLLGVAGGLALALSEGLRKKVLDALFGAEEEFEYTSTTTGGGAAASSGGADAGSTGGTAAANGGGSSTTTPAAGSTS